MYTLAPCPVGVEHLQRTRANWEDCRAWIGWRIPLGRPCRVGPSGGEVVRTVAVRTVASEVVRRVDLH